MMDIDYCNKKIRPLCKYCGSSNVTRDAEASWDVHKQEWVLAAVQDQAYCPECDDGGETTLIEVELSDE